MASGTPVALAILQALETEIASISVAGGADTDVVYVAIGDTRWQDKPMPAAFLRPGFSNYATNGNEGPLDALAADMQLVCDLVVNTMTDPEGTVLKFERDVVQAVIDFAPSHPGGALDIQPVSSEPWIIAEGDRAFHGTTLTFTARFRASRTNLNTAV